MDSVKIPLKHPIEAHGQTVTELELRGITLGALEGVRLKVDVGGSLDIDLGDVTRLVAGMAQIPPSSAAQIDIRDAVAAKDVLAGFFTAFLATGGK